jgi:hypothetical protein
MNETPRLHERLETLIAILLGLAAVLVAVAGYQATLRDGDSIKSFNAGIRSINDANGFYNEAVQVANRDTALFLEYAKASQEENEDLATYVHDKLMDENLQGATAEWLADDTDEIASPLVAASYAVPQQDEADKLTKLTDQQFAEAHRLDDQGDKFSLVGVIVASSLFFLGIAGVMSSPRIKFAGTGLGSVTLAVAFAMWLTV